MIVPPFKPNSRCPKCGCRQVATRYEPPIEKDPAWYSRKQSGRFPDTEYQHRTCNRCSYGWPEACIPPRAKKQDQTA